MDIPDAIVSYGAITLSLASKIITRASLERDKAVQGGSIATLSIPRHKLAGSCGHMENIPHVKNEAIISTSDRND